MIAHERLAVALFDNESFRHLNRLRVRAACEALRGTNDRVADIAAGCGFNNLSNFNRQFKRLVGCSPLEYRRSVRLLS